MPRTKSSDKRESALVAEPSASGNPHLNKLIENLKEGYRTHRHGKSNRHIRIDHTAMIPLPFPVWAWTKDANGNKVEPRLLFRAGWYLSVEEAAMVEKLLSDEDNASLNEQIKSKMEAEGLEYEKTPATQQEVKVVG